ncbi:hypothetical protein [Rhodoferax sp.]|uniref:hypothetical protein n=1 Tax=Rhodoferax sp. TaxID=50421 RepID=UPI002ACD4F2C|nr:hypothetical protein [Rhodoferax sp.]MDZ7920028.1 hypothetical protein [Rhodoferax sp.]
MKNVKRMLQSAAWTGLACILVACGNGGKGVPPEEKRVVIGTAAHIKAKRESTHRLGKPLPFGVTHQRFKDGKLLADDAPHPYILSSGSLLVDPRKNALIQVAYHEDAKGTLSEAVPSSFMISDPSIVSAVVTHPSTNAAMVTLTGKKGNSFITALDARGDAISKFMVLSAEPQEDVLVVSDPDIHPMLCKGLAMGDNPLSCYTATATTFDRGYVGDQFFMDDYLKSGRASRKFILFDDASLAKLKALNTNGSDSFDKRAIYFEKIDTLFVMNDGISKISSMRVNGNSSEGVLPNRNALEIHHVATQEEFNTYIDFGGKLSSSPIRDFEQGDKLVHEITPGSNSKLELVGVQYSDGSEQAVSLDTVTYLTNAVHQPVKKHIYALKSALEGRQGLGSGVQCHVAAEFGLNPKISLNSFKSTATVGIGGDFKWNGGKAEFGVHLKPAVEVGGQIAIQMSQGLAFECSFEIKEFPVTEIGIPLFGNAKIIIPIEAKTRIAVGSTAKGDAILVTPKFTLGKAGDYFEPGETGFTYSPNTGINSQYSMEATLAKRHLGLAQGTNLQSSQLSGKSSINMVHLAGVSAGLAMRAEVKAWIFGGAEVGADLAEAIIGFKTDAGYDIDADTETYSSAVLEAKSGIGLFLESHPSITVKTKFFTLSFNLIDFGSQDIFFWPMKYAEPAEEAFEPAESKSKITFSQCISESYGKSVSTNCDTPSPHSDTREYVYSSQQISFDLLPYLPGRTSAQVSEYVYDYIYLDKGTGKPVKVSIPSKTEGGGKDAEVKINKYGVTNIVAESIRSTVVEIGPDGRRQSPTCWIWFKGEEQYRELLRSCL